MEQLRALTVPGGHYRGAEYRFEMPTPAGVLLFEGRRLVETAKKKGGSGGLLSVFGKPDGSSFKAALPQLVYSAEGGATNGLLFVRKLPTQFPLDRELEVIDQISSGGLPQLERVDALVPASMTAFEHQGWQATTRRGTLYIALARAPDGRSFTSICQSSAPRLLADKRCAETMGALTISP